MFNLIIGAVLSVVLVLSPIWLYHYLRERDVGQATRESSRLVFRFGLGVAAAGVAIAVEFAQFLSEIGTMLAMAPGAVSHSLIAVVGYASLSGVINLRPETFALFVIVMLGGVLLTR